MTNTTSLYPDILFHFTVRNALWGILKNTFSVSYSDEKIVGKRQSIDLSIPMVSFCDLRLSELKVHMEKYGDYGIGLTKEWANKQGLNPVFYVNRHSPFTLELIKDIKEQQKEIELVSNVIESNGTGCSSTGLLNTYQFMKNYEGDLVRRSGATTRNYRFADEREWRYVLPQGKNLLMHDTPSLKRNLNKLVDNCTLGFEPEDIKYLIVKTDKEIEPLIHHLENVKNRFDKKTRMRLASRILTAEQINRDV